MRRRRLALNWYSPVWGHFDGYGNAAEQMIRALDARGHKIGIMNQKELYFNGPVDRSWLRAHPKRFTRYAIYFTLPTTWMCTHRYNVGFSMYESSDLPQDWKPKLNEVEEIWVPSTYCRDIFARHSNRPIHVIPLGVNTTLFTVKRNPRAGGLRFLHIGSGHDTFRKGGDIAVQAFLAAFPSENDVELILQAPGGTPPASPDPRVTYTGESIAQEAFADYFGKFDALLYTSRGEGFGLIPLEAASTGLPVFHSGQTGMRDYAQVGTVIQSREVPAQTQEGTWFEIDTRTLATELRRFAVAPEPYEQKALEDAEFVRRHFSWDLTAERIERRVAATA